MLVTSRLNAGQGLRITDYDPGVIGFPPLFEHRNIERWQALSCEQSNVVDPWQTESTDRFPISADGFLSLAAGQQPKIQHPTVSAFTEWVYSLYVTYPGAAILKTGRDAEKPIFSVRSSVVGQKKFTHFHPSGWRLAYNGLQSNTSKKNILKAYKIPSLRALGQPLTASPDLVFVGPDESEVVIVEIKFSNKYIPSNLWPNVWAQLWAYSQIPEFANAKRLAVVGEVWGLNEGAASIDTLQLPVYLRKSIVRNPRNPAFDSFFEELFRLYGGVREK